jgi:hypothetical protein
VRPAWTLRRKFHRRGARDWLRGLWACCGRGWGGWTARRLRRGCMTALCQALVD